MLAVVVLYGMAPNESPALQALLAHCAGQVDVAVWDNSPVAHAAPDGFTGEFRADPANPGLAAAYNFGLELAKRWDVPWLMLLDQDTAVTAEYLDEVELRVNTAAAEIVGFVPRLMHRGRLVSPLRLRRWGPAAASQGNGPLQAFNSGAVLRCAALRAAGGFDVRFPLDYLDHATFAALQRRGGKLEVLGSAMEHGLSSDTGVAATAAERARQRSTLAAEARFYRLHGDALDRVVHPVRLLRRAVSVVGHKGDWRSAVQIAGAALRTRVPWGATTTKAGKE